VAANLATSSEYEAQANDRYLRILFSNGSRGSSVYRRLGMPAFSARSLALDGVSLGAGRQG
jgi:hypothetical protein